METEKFKIGDRVVVFDEFQLNPDDAKLLQFQWMTDMPQVGDKGTVCYIYSEGSIGIDFDIQKEGFHNCNKTAREGHGFCLHPEKLKHVEEILTIKKWLTKKKDSR